MRCATTIRYKYKGDFCLYKKKSFYTHFTKTVVNNIGLKYEPCGLAINSHSKVQMKLLLT